MSRHSQSLEQHIGDAVLLHQSDETPHDILTSLHALPMRHGLLHKPHHNLSSAFRCTSGNHNPISHSGISHQSHHGMFLGKAHHGIQSGNGQLHLLRPVQPRYLSHQYLQQGILCCIK